MYLYGELQNPLPYFLRLTKYSTSCTEGIPPLVIADSFFDGDEKEREDTLAYLPADLQFQHKLHTILHKALAAMSRTHLKSINCDVSNLRSLISIFDSQLLTLATLSPNELGRSSLPRIVNRS
jgi:transcriptional regulatory protein LEU3